MQIKIIIKTQRLTLSSNKIVCGTNNFIECLFDFQSSDWTELEKWALFKDGRNTYEMYIQDNKCIIPAQCISDQGEVIMSVVGRNNGKNITATAEDKLLLISGRAFDNPDEERLTPTYLEEVLGKVRDESLKTSESEANAAQSAQEAADSAAAALQSEKNAKASEKAAETSKEAAAQSEANSKTSEDAARGYADDAEASKGATTALTVNAAASANAAAESAKQAAESEKKAAQSERNAKLSEGNAKTSETNAQSSASESAQSAANAEKSNKSAEKHSTDAGTFADNAELSAQQVTELAEQVNRDAMQVASDKKSVTELTGQAVEAAGNAQTSMEQAGQIKTDTQTIADNALQAMSDVITKAKADIDAQGTEIITQATAQANMAQSAADGIRDIADTLQADNEHLKADLKHANRRISVLYDLGKGITHRYETDNDTAYSKDIPSGATISFKNMQCIDLTQMFGAGNEPTLEQCREIFANDYYPYNAGTLVSADVTDVQVGDKVISLPNSISLKSAGSVYDSLEFYEQDGKYYQKHAQRVDVVDLGTLVWRKLSGYEDIYFALVANQAQNTTNYNCSHYTSSSRPYHYLNDMEITGSGGEGKACWIKNTAIGSLDDLKASLQGVLLYYELATPIVTVTEVDNRFDAVDCKAGDKVTFVGNRDYHLPVPNEEEYLIALNEVTA